MKRLYTLFFLSVLSLFPPAFGQRVTRSFNDVSMSEALKWLNERGGEYNISFLYNELEDFRVTTSVKNKSVPDAVQQLIGFYPIKMTVQGKEIAVECPQKASTRYKGTVLDETGQPMAYATIALLNPVDSTLLTGGVSNESGRFVIPTEAKRVVVKCSFVGYRTYYRNCEAGDIGTIQMRPAEYIINGVTVEGTRIMNYVDKSVHTFTIEQIMQARNVRDLLEHVEDLKVDPVSNKIQRMDGGSVKILINGVAASDIDLKGIPADST